eukprot:CFRG4323T1
MGHRCGRMKVPGATVSRGAHNYKFTVNNLKHQQIPTRTYTQWCSTSSGVSCGLFTGVSVSRSYVTNRNADEEHVQMLEKFANFKQTSVSLQQLAQFNVDADEAKSYEFLRTELPIRYAHMLKEIDNLPDVLLKSKQVQDVRRLYFFSFKDVVSVPPIHTLQSDINAQKVAFKEFVLVMKTCMQRHAPVVPKIAEGVMMLKKRGAGKDNFEKMVKPVQYFLDRIYMSRIGMMILTGMHVENFGTKHLTQPENFSGIDIKCNVAHVIKDAADNAKFLCEQYYSESPDVNVVTASPDFRFPYIPSHLYHIMFELFKNSMRAVVETHKDSGSLPAIKVVLTHGQEDLTIKISDEGGGISRSDIGSIFTYLYTTADTPMDEDDMTSADMNNAPLAGFGYGLPISRLYARYMGGELKIVSMEGYGTDAFVYLLKSADEAEEVLPEYTRREMKQYTITGSMSDWLLPPEKLNNKK